MVELQFEFEDVVWIFIWKKPWWNINISVYWLCQISEYHLSDVSTSNGDSLKNLKEHFVIMNVVYMDKYKKYILLKIH